jgi:hypothetical protein
MTDPMVPMEVVPMVADALLQALADRTSIEAVQDRLEEAKRHGAALHLAVMREPYLEFVLNGRKTIESRFSINRVSPFGDVRVGDVLALKRQSGPVVGLAVVEHAAFYELDAPTWRLLRHQFARPLCAEDDEFWITRERARYATLMTVVHAHQIEPVRVQKRDRRGWVRLGDTYRERQLVL